jgi:hypothetical protein
LKIQLSEDEAKLYSKLHVSTMDIGFARYCASVLLKKGWHVQPWERRGTIYQQQAAFTSALVTSYARPFTSSHGWPKIPEELINHNDQETVLHKWLVTMRNKVYAHSDSVMYSIRPWRMGDFTTAIESVPALRITAEDTKLFQAMSGRLLEAFRAKMNALLAEAPMEAQS